jgi:hypothetical protein
VQDDAGDLRILGPATQLRIEQAEHVERQRVQRFLRIELSEAQTEATVRGDFLEQHGRAFGLRRST